MKQNDNCCWLNEDELILSFSPVDGFILKEFATHDELIDFVFKRTSIEHYKVQ